MRPARGGQLPPQRGGRPSPALAVLSVLSAAYIVTRLWQGQSEITALRSRVASLDDLHGGSGFLSSGYSQPGCDGEPMRYDVRAGPHDEASAWRGLGSEPLEALPVGPRDGNIVGGVDLIDGGVVHGWACARSGGVVAPVEVRAYVDGALATVGVSDGALGAHQAAQHACTSGAGGLRDGTPAVGFALRLPPLALMTHELRVFAAGGGGGAAKSGVSRRLLLQAAGGDGSADGTSVVGPDAVISTAAAAADAGPEVGAAAGSSTTVAVAVAADAASDTSSTVAIAAAAGASSSGAAPSVAPPLHPLGPPSTSYVELDSSPMRFRESAVVPDSEEALRRKDAIILFRNAQLSRLWEETKVRKPWPDDFDEKSVLSSLADTGGGNRTERRLLVAVGVNTHLGDYAKRELLRQTWFPKKDTEAEARRGLAVRFTLGRSEQAGDPAAAQVAKEARDHDDVLQLDAADASGEGSTRVLETLAALVRETDADFYACVDDDVAINLDALHEHLAPLRGMGNRYIGCMKSGVVVTDSSSRWFEPAAWRFGDALGGEGANYPRHAAGKLFVLSRSVARYLAQSRDVLYKYANEDVAIGTWLLGLDVTYMDEPRMCCGDQTACGQAYPDPAQRCLGFYEGGCNGVCQPTKRMEGIWKGCMGGDGGLSMAASTGDGGGGGGEAGRR